MRRRLPHDITNALAASALVLESGLADLRDGRSRDRGRSSAPPHRIEPVGERDGVQWFNDSKATTPHAAAVAIRGFEHVVLIAGGRNKGLDLSPMAAEPQRLRSVVAIGESAAEISRALRAALRGRRADSMEAAVVAAADSARRGDAVLLSPGCASFDWYSERRLHRTRRSLPPARRRAGRRSKRSDFDDHRSIDSRAVRRTPSTSRTVPTVAERRAGGARAAAAIAPASRAGPGAAATPTSPRPHSVRRRSRTT